MSDQDTIPHDEFVVWRSPASLLGTLDTTNFENVVKVLHPALTAGKIRAACQTMTVENAARHHLELPASLWATWTPLADLLFWVTGNLIRPIAGGSNAISAYGVRFDPVGLARVFPELSTLPVEAERIEPSAKGGRPAGKNGEPIAGIAKHLLALPAAELASYTAEAVAAELVEEYRRLNLQPPNPDNAKRDAAGILRAVRN